MPLANPLQGLPNQRQIWSWISFDVANQSFTLLINTLLFSIFFQQVVVQNPATDDRWWSALFAGSMLLVVLASPVAGAMADGKNWKKRCLLASGFSCALLTCLFGLIQPGQLWLAVLLYIPANFMFNIGENFLASFLPQLARRQDLGRVSGFSWGVAYCSALFMLLLTALVMTQLGLLAPDQWRPFFVAAGVWFAIFAVPTLLVLREHLHNQPVNTDPPQPGNALVVGLRRLMQTLRELPRFRDLALLLLASLFYGAGMNVVIAFASILAKEFGFSDTDLVLFVAVITVSGIVGTLIPTFYQDRLGHKQMTLVLLGLWICTTIYFAFVAYQHHIRPPNQPESKLPIWVAGNLLGLGIGSLGAANRAFVGYLTPPSRSAEFFGLWGMVFKLAAVLTLPFGYVKDTVGTHQALLVLVGLIFIGFVITLLINPSRGAQAAQSA